MPRRLLILMVLALVGLTCPVGAASAGQTSLLFSTTSKDLRITGSGKAMRVSLPASAPLAWFTDRPMRKAGSSTASVLISGWTANGFDTDPPNAALVTTTHGVTMQTIITLRDPRTAKGRVSFRYTVIDGGSMLGMRTKGRPHVGRYVGELFVDSATVPPCSVGSTYTHTSFYQCVTSGVSDYRFYNDVKDGVQTTYACGAGLRVHHYAVGNVTYSLQACPQYTVVGSSQRDTFDFGTGSPAIAYTQNSFVSVPAGVTFLMSFDPICSITTDPASGVATCVAPAGSTVYISRPTAGNTRISACGLNGASTLTYDSTASGTRGNVVNLSACDTVTSFADVPTATATVVVHASTDIKLLLNAG